MYGKDARVEGRWDSLIVHSNWGLIEMGNGSYLVKFLTLVPQGHSSFITHLDWSKDGNFIMSNSGDYEILYCEWQGDGDN